MPLILSSPSYSPFKKFQISCAVFIVVILVKMVDVTAANKLALAFDFLCLLSL
ncbi:hypothetical protein Scep_009442 [Stephania cephalantha]|uniref:Uncharacterized protein n=1 Tax=Stephania cephalantha TaxID=152367 RepID=A0AAP0JT64_9MAGN